MTYLVRAFVIAFALQAFPSPVHAEDTAEELAARFVELSRLDARRAQMIDILTANLREAARNDPALQNANLPRSVREELIGIVEEELEVFVEELGAPLQTNMIKFYVDQFSKDELRELIAMYESPVFVKQLDILPNLTEQSAEIARAHMSTVQQRLAGRIEEWVEKQKE